MAGIHEISAYQQNAESWKAAKASSPDQVNSQSVSSKANTENRASDAVKKTDIKPWTPLSATSSLIPKQSDYGFAVGDVKLSDTAKDYYEKLKAKFGGMDFIVVSSDMIDSVKRNAAMYGNASKPVVLIDEAKLERMATDEDYRNKYEGIIAMSQAKLTEAKNSLLSSGIAVKNFGISVDENGNEKFFATVEKSQQLQKERIERKTEEHRAEKKAAEKKAAKEREAEIREMTKEERDAYEGRIREAVQERQAELDKITNSDDAEDDKEYVTITSNSMEELLSKVQAYSYELASERVMTDAERMLGSHIDFKG